MTVTILHGDCRDVLPDLAAEDFDCAIIAPPYGETSLADDAPLFCDIQAAE